MKSWGKESNWVTFGRESNAGVIFKWYDYCMKKNSCESCLMPLDQDPGVRESDKNCSLCFKDGKLCYEGTDVKEFQAEAYKQMRARGMNPVKAWIFTYLIRFAPRWKKAQS